MAVLDSNFNLFLNVSGILHPERAAFEWKWIAIYDTNLNAAKNIRLIGLADLPGYGDCIKIPSVAILVSVSATAKDIETASLCRSQEATPEQLKLLGGGSMSPHLGVEQRLCLSFFTDL